MDLVADYARSYGGVPRRDQSWHEVLALAARVSRNDLREKLIIADGMTLGQPSSGPDAVTRASLRASLERIVQGLA